MDKHALFAACMQRKQMQLLFLLKCKCMLFLRIRMLPLLLLCHKLYAVCVCVVFWGFFLFIFVFFNSRGGGQIYFSRETDRQKKRRRDEKKTNKQVCVIPYSYVFYYTSKTVQNNINCKFFLHFQSTDRLDFCAETF